MPKQGDRSMIMKSKDGQPYILHYQPKLLKLEKKRIQFIAKALAPVIPWEEPIEITIEFYFPWRKDTSQKIKEEWIANGVNFKSTKPDLDNLEKMICDALEGIIFKNDSQIVRKKSEKLYCDAPHIEVMVKKIER